MKRKHRNAKYGKINYSIPAIKFHFITIFNQFNYYLNTKVLIYFHCESFHNHPIINRNY